MPELHSLHVTLVRNNIIVYAQYSIYLASAFDRHYISYFAQVNSMLKYIHENKKFTKGAHLQLAWLDLGVRIVRNFGILFIRTM